MAIETINVDDLSNNEHLVGINLLMNNQDDNVSEADNNKPDISLGDLSDIQISQPNSPKTISINIGPPDDEPISIPESKSEPEPEIGSKPVTEQTFLPTFKFDTIPEPEPRPEELQPIGNIMPNTDIPEPIAEITYFDRYKLLEKIRKAEKKGKVFSKNYTFDSKYEEMKSEYDAYIEEDEKAKSCKFQGTMLMMIVGQLESLNKKYDPLDIDLDGWKDQISDNIGDYDDIFMALHEKYRSNGERWPPEIELIMKLCGSAILLSMSNSMFKNSMPDLGDIMKSNPELAKNFMDATAQQMKQTNPGFGNFVQSTLNQTAPPPPVNTQKPSQQQAFQPHISPPPKTYRPDLEKSRQDDGISISRQNAPVKRPEMSGPADISSLLSGIKQKPVKTPINKPPSIDPRSPPPVMDTILPKKSKRRTRSDKNTVSLDL